MKPMQHSHLAFVVFSIIVLAGSKSPFAQQQDDPAVCNIAPMIEEVENNPSKAISKLIRLYNGECLGFERNLGDGKSTMPCASSTDLYPGLCKDLFEWAACLNRPDFCERPNLVEPDAVQVEATNLLIRIHEAAAALPVDSQLTSPFLMQLGLWQADNVSTLRLLIAERGSGEWDFDANFILFEGTENLLDVGTVIDALCVDATDANASACTRAFDLGARLLTLAGLHGSVLSAVQGEQLDKALRAIETLDARWDAYFTNGRAALPWELILNGHFAKPERGFNGPPNWQIIALHPTTSVVAEGVTTDDLTGALALELIGFYAWRWDGAQMKAPINIPSFLSFLDSYPLGGSVTLGFDGKDDPGLGLLLHLPRNWSIGGYVDRDGDANVLLSVDVAKFFVDEGSQRKNLVDAFRGKD